MASDETGGGLDFSAAADRLLLRKPDDQPKALDFGAAADRLIDGQAALALKVADGTNPDQAARALDLSKRSGLPLPAVEGSEDEVEARLRDATVSKALEAAPTTRLFFADPLNAKIARDDVESLTAVESAWKQTKGVTGAFAGGVVDTPGMTLRGWGELYGVADRALRRPMIAGLEAIGATGVIDALTAPVLPWWMNPGEIIKRPGEEIGKIADALAPAAEDQNFATDVAGGLGQLTAQVTAAILTGGASTAANTAMLLGQGAEQQREMIDAAGKSGTAEGDTATVLGAGITLLTERFGLDTLLEKIPGTIKSRIMRTLAGAGSEAAQEVVEGVLQNLTAVALYDPDNPLFDGLAYQGGVAGFAGGIVSALLPGKQVHQARSNKEKADAVQAAWEASKLGERSPEKKGELGGALLRDQGIDSVSIPAAKLQEFLQNGEDDPTEMMRNLGVADQMDEAVLLNGDVEITPEAFSQYIHGTEGYAKLAEDIRWEQDGWTAREADEYEKAGLRDEIDSVAESMATFDPAVIDQTAQIQKEVETMMKAAGESGDTVTYAAMLTAQRYATRAERAGVSPLQLWEQDNLQIRRDDTARPPVTDLDLTLDKARSVDAESFLGLSKTPMLDALKARGGVDPKGKFAGELRALGVTPKTHRGLFKKGGMGATVDDRQGVIGGAAERGLGDDNLILSELPFLSDLQDDGTGYVPPDVIIDAVRREVAGNPIRSADEVGQIEAFNADIGALQSRLDEYNARNETSLTVNDDVSKIRTALAELDGPEFEQSATDSEAFKAWFGDSKVVDADGKPLVVYHGTDANFESFDAKKRGDATASYSAKLGFFFTDNARVAGSYGNHAATSARIEKILKEAEAFGKRGDWENHDAKILEAEQAEAAFNDPQNRLRGQNILPVYLSIQNPLVIDAGGETFAAFEADLTGEISRAQKAGHDGVIVRNLDDAVGLVDHVADHYVAFKPEQIKSVNNRGTFSADSPKILEQSARGSIQFGQAATTIFLNRNADRSTFLHESGHLFLEQLRADAKEFGGSAPRLVDDLNTVQDWWAGNSVSIKAEAIDHARKAKDGSAVAALTAMPDSAVKAFARANVFDQAGTNSYLVRAMHEQWARGAEDYFRTGQAPSVGLQEAFNRFRAWLVSIYSALKHRTGAEHLDVQFSPEVKAVMDRMLATDEEIALVEEQYNLKALFGSAEEIGMTPKQFETYQRSVARAREDAKTAQLKKHLNQVERAQKEWWKEERDKLRVDVANDLSELPVYRAIYGLARGTTPAGEVLPLKPGRLDRAGVVAVLESEEALARLPKVRGRAIYSTAKKEAGAHPDVVAQLYGYDDGRTMLLEMMNVKPLDQAVDEETDARMKAEFGDMLTDGTAMDEALAATHNDKRADVLAAELNALRESGPKMKVAFIRQWAAERIGRRKVDDIQPSKFTSAERKYGKQAGKLLKAGDRLGAQRAKFQQLLNFQMAKESYKVRAEVAKARDYLEKFTSTTRVFKAIDADYIDNIRAILSAYQLGPRLSDATKVKLELAAVAEWVKKKQTDDGAILEVPQRILDADEKTHFRDLTLDEFRTLHDTIKNIEAQGRLSKTAMVDGEERELSEMAEEIVARLDDRPQIKRAARKALEQNPDWQDKALGKLASFDAALRKVEFLLEHIDGEKNGPAHRYLFQTFADAETARADMSKAVTAPILKALENLPADVRKGLAEKVTVPLLGRTFRRSDLLMMALNVGNESNYYKMIDGSAKDINEGSVGWTEEGVDEALANLTAQEWDFVQTVWDAFEGMYPQVEAIFRRENGVAPERVEARPIETRWGQTLRGGYFPMMYDPERSAQARDIENKTALEAMQSTVVKASVNSSMTKARTGFSAPVLLDLEKLPNHIERTAHYITHYEAVRSTRRLLSKSIVAKAITNKVGREYYDELKNWVNELAANGQPANPTSISGKLVEAMRTNATVALMGVSYTTGASQLFGLANGVDALAQNRDGTYSARAGTKWIAKGLVKYLSNPAAAKREVFALSGEMRHRLENTDREVRHALKTLSGKKGSWKQMQRFSLMGIAGAQLYMVDFPTWLGAYNRALSTGATVTESVREADSILRMSQTAGGLKDLSAFQRERGTSTLFSMFYSYFNLLYNLQVQAIGKVKAARDVPQLAARAFMLLALPTIADSLMRLDWPDDDEDYATWISLKAALFGMSSIPFLRDMVGIAEGFGYSVTPLDGLGESLAKSIKTVAKAWDDGEMNAKALKSIVSVLGFGTGLPSTALNRVIGAADAMHDGKDVSPYDFLIGYREDK